MREKEAERACGAREPDTLGAGGVFAAEFKQRLAEFVFSFGVNAFGSELLLFGLRCASWKKKLPTFFYRVGNSKRAYVFFSGL